MRGTDGSVLDGHSAARSLTLAALLVTCSGCAGYGMLQTAKTQAPGQTTLGFGTSLIQNSARKEHELSRTLMGEIRVRTGINERVEATVAAYELGGHLSTKINLLPRTSRFAIAPRVGGGGGAFGTDKAVLAFGGVLVSVDVFRDLALYGGATFFNHWIYRSKPDWAETGPGERFADRRGNGDGLVQVGAGVRVGRTDALSLLFEYNRLIPAQDDPGDWYRFQAVHMGSVLVSTCISMGDGCSWGAKK